MNAPEDNYIIYVDDDEDDRLLMLELFKCLEPVIKLIVLESARALLELLKSIGNASLPCLIVADYNMPVVSGIDLIAILKNDERYARIPVVLFTTSRPGKKEYNRCDSVPVELKPRTFKEWQHMVLKLVQHSNLCKT
jgi:CheY-like chemotaxis protein